MAISCVIFDWAGTTVDFGSLSPVSAFQEAFARVGGIEVTQAETRAPMGMFKIDHIRTMLGMSSVRDRWQHKHGAAPTENDVQAIYHAFEPALMAVLDRHCDLKPGVLPCMAELRSRGIRIGSTTGFTRAMMDVVVPAAAAAGYAPDTFVTAEDVGGFGRPWPYMVFENMRRLTAPSVASVVKVGDTASDMAEAKAAGIMAVGVVDGSSLMGLSREEFQALGAQELEQKRQETREAFFAAGAQYVINDLRDLPRLIADGSDPEEE